MIAPPAAATPILLTMLASASPMAGMLVRVADSAASATAETMTRTWSAASMRKAHDQAEYHQYRRQVRNRDERPDQRQCHGNQAHDFLEYS